MAINSSPDLAASNRPYRRAYTRYPVDIKGKCCTQDKQCATVDIRDFCLGGIFLIYSCDDAGQREWVAPDIDDIIEVLFDLPGDTHQQIHLRARVVRSDLNSIGAAFIDADSDRLQRVLQHAKQAQTSAATNNGVRSTEITAHAEQILEVIRKKSFEPISALINSYLSRQSDILLEMADKSRDINEQNSYFEALGAFRKNADHFTSSFVSEMSRTLQARPEAINDEQSFDEQALSLNTLSLVDDDAIDTWIARSDITSKSESFYSEALSGIEQRLSLLYNMEIGKQNNPIGPDAFSRAYQNALNEIHLSKALHLVCCKIFRDVLKDGLGSLYDDINGFLITNNILPDLNYRIKKSQDHTTPGKTEQIENKSAVEHPEQASSTAYSTSAIDSSPISEPDTNQLYTLITSLQSLRNDSGQQQSLNFSDGETAHLPKYNPEELLGRVSELALENLPSATQQHDTNAMQSAVLQMLRQLQQSPDGQRLGAREAGIMEATGSLYESLFSDSIITNGVKAWLGEVEMPLLKEAIKDESVLADRSHIARRFINQLSQLELYNDESRGVISNSVKNTIEELLQQVAAQPGMDEQLISSVLKKVDALVNTQNRAYNDNLQEVLDRCELQQDIPELESTIPFTQQPLTSTTDDQLKEWRKRVRRLMVGEWILFNADSVESSRLKVAWISERYDKYVFVNLLGIMAGSLSVDDLALQLESGSAIVLDNADEPAMDRAQYNMLQKLHQQLLHETTHDATTGLLNRKEFESLLRQRLKMESSGSGSNILCFIDLDYFDVINTTFGYDTGDRVLADIGNLLSEALDNRGAIARVGGNQFAMLLTGSNLKNARQVTEQQRLALSEYSLVQDGISSSVTFCSSIIPIDLDRHNISRLLQTGEAACRLAKHKGINVEQVIDDDDRSMEENKKILFWAAKINDSLNNETLQLRYQPITPIGDSSLTPHAEILLGVTDHQGQLISPEHFILAAERYRRMPEVDRWVIKNVFNFFNQNPALLKDIGGIAINLSGLSINDDSFIPFILEQIEQAAIPTEHLCFEVTETAGVSNLSNAAQFIKEIKATGCSFSLDDFGTGMSSYSYLKNLPVDFIKIDGSFVRDIENNDNDRAVVKSITEIGHFMGKKIIAESVENESTIELLREIGVDYAQGWAICKPKLLRQ